MYITQTFILDVINRD